MATVNKAGLVRHEIKQGNYQDINKLCAINSIVDSTKKMFPEYLDRSKKLRYVGLENETFNLTKELHKNFDLDVLSYEFDKTVYNRAMQTKPSFARIELKNILNHKYNGENVFWYDSVNCLTDKFANDLTEMIKHANFNDKLIFVVTYIRNGINNYFTLGAQYSPYKEIRFVEVISKAIANQYVKVDNAKITLYANIQSRAENKKEQKGSASEMIQVVFEVVKR